MSVCFSSETVTGIVADGALADGEELLEPLLLAVATGLTPVILPLTVLPSGSSTVTGSCSFASLCLVASRSTVTTRLVDVVLRIGSALPAPLLALPAPEDDEPLPDEAALADDEPPPPLRALTDPEPLVDPFVAPAEPEVLADLSSDWRSLFWVCRSLTMASRALAEGVPDRGEVLGGVGVVVVGVVGVVVVGAGVVVVGLVTAGQPAAGVVVVEVVGLLGHTGLVTAGVLFAVAALEVVRSTNSAWGSPATR